MKKSILFILIIIAQVYAFAEVRISGTVLMDDTKKKNVKITLKGSNVPPVLSDEKGKFDIYAKDIDWGKGSVKLQVEAGEAFVVSPQKSLDNTVDVLEKTRNEIIIKTSSAVSQKPNDKPISGYQIGFYSIRVLALAKPLDSLSIIEIQKITGLEVVESKSSNKFIYSLGRFSKQEDAESVLDSSELLEEIPLVGKRKNFFAISILKPLPPFWRVQIFKSEKKPDSESIEKLSNKAIKLKFGVKILSESNTDGSIFYYGYLDTHRENIADVNKDLIKIKKVFPDAMPVEFEFAERRVVNKKFSAPVEYAQQKKNKPQQNNKIAKAKQPMSKVKVREPSKASIFPNQDRKKSSTAKTKKRKN